MKIPDDFERYPSELTQAMGLLMPWARPLRGFPGTRGGPATTTGLAQAEAVTSQSMGSPVAAPVEPHQTFQQKRTLA